MKERLIKQGSLRYFIVFFFLLIYRKSPKGRYRLKNLVRKVMGNYSFPISFCNHKVYVSKNSYIESELLFKDFYEKLESDLIFFFAENEYSYVDIGANIGVHVMRANSSPKIKDILAFEPSFENFKKLSENVYSNNSVSRAILLNLGVGDKEETVTLHINNEWNKGKHSIVKNFHNEIGYTIPVIKLDTFSSFLDGKSIFIKLDVEGYEPNVLKGAEKVLTNTNECLLLVELIEENLVYSGWSCTQILDFMCSFGFTYIYLIGETSISKVEKFTIDGNYLFIKGEKSNLVFKDFFETLNRYKK